MQNTGLGQNYGINFTLEKYISNGYYYMITASLFNSKYKGDDNVWRNTRYNRNFTFNFLIGKEWQIGKNKQNVVVLFAKVSYQGGDHYSPINFAQSIFKLEAVFDKKMPFQNSLILHSLLI